MQRSSGMSLVRAHTSIHPYMARSVSMDAAMCVCTRVKKGCQTTYAHPLFPPRRFLRARKFDVAKTKAMLLSAEQWRKDWNVEDIVK